MPETSRWTLTSGHQYKILKKVYASIHVDQNTKDAFLEKIIGDKQNNIAKNLRFQCHASIANAQIKEEVWQELIDPKSKLSIYERQAKMHGFYQFDQIALCAPYFDKFYSALPDLCENHSYKYMCTFFSCMLPRMEIQDSHIAKLMMIKTEVPDNNVMYINVL